MHSMHIIGSRGPGGAEGFYCRLVKGLARSGFPVHAINPPHSEVGKRLNGAVPQAQIRMHGAWDLLARFRIERAIGSLRPAIVQTYLGRATRLTHIPDRSGPIHIARLGGYYNLKAYRHAHAWIGNTRGICAYLIRGGFPADRVYYIGNFVDIPAEFDGDRNTYREQLGIPGDALVVLTVGRLHKVKGIDVLLHARTHLPERIAERPVHFIIAGDGPMRRELERLAQDLPFNERTHFVGWQQDPSPYYEICDLLVSPTYHEALGNTILEAWAYHCAVLATGTEGPKELIDHGETGWLVTKGDPLALAGGILRCLADSSLRGRLGEMGHQKVRREFSPEVIIRRYQQLYAQLIEKWRRSAEH
ncbi:MAG: glycosyltransferase [Gammaproteobacteria bacterium]